MDKKQQAFEDWKNGMKYKEIAEKYGISLSTVKSWAVRYWKKNEPVIVSRKGNKNVVIISEAEYNELAKAKRNAEYLEKLNRADEQIIVKCCRGHYTD